MRLTIFTPVYNRRDLIMRLYHSLEAQTCKEFTWLVVDDGSTDGVENVFLRLKETASFPIEYIYQENHGKHTAHNAGVRACTTELFVCVDSDDTLFPNAVRTILEIDQKYSGKHILGYYFRKIDTKGNISGGSFELKREYVGLRELYHKYNFKGELVIVLKTDLVREYEFPVFENERFVSELVYYNEINHIAPMVWIDEAIYQYEYQESGYTKNANRLISNNPYGAACGYLSEAYFSTNLVSRVKCYAEYAAITDVFLLNRKRIPQKRIGLIVILLAKILKRHYVKLFLQIKNRER